MNIKLDSILLEDLAKAANKRSISVDLLITQILSTEMLIDKYLTKEDQNIIINIYKKYFH